MVTDAMKKYREIFAYGLLGVAALYFISGLSLLFKSSDDIGGATFSDKAALFGYLFASPMLIVALAAAVALVTGWGENSKNAKTVVTAALVIGALSLLFGVISWLSAFGSDQPGGFTYFAGVVGAGKVVAIFLGIAQLGLLGLVTFYAFAVFQTFPKPERVQQPQGQWGQQGWGQQQGQWGQQQGYDQPQQGWGQQQGQWGQQQGYDQPQQGWGQAQQAGPSPQGYSGYGDQGGQGGQQWGAAATGAAGGWGDQSGAQAEQQGMPASSWGQEPADTGAAGWGEQPATPETQQGWGTPGESSTAAGTSSEETQVWGGSTEPQPGHAGEPAPAEEPDGERKDDGEQPPPQGWWQQPSQ